MPNIKVLHDQRPKKEAKAINWAIKLTHNLDFVSIFIKSNSKVVVKALFKPRLKMPWRILNVCSNMGENSQISRFL